MAVLDEIRVAVERETEFYRSKFSLKSLKRKVQDLPPTRGFRQALATDSFGLIAEVKLRSPSMGRMSLFAGSVVAKAPYFYNKHPLVKAISVLTNHSHFGGSAERLRDIHRTTQKPILRKDFISDEYQVYHARAMRADAILLMANYINDKNKFAELHQLAKSLGLDVLCEVHSQEEIAALPNDAEISGINSRNFSSTWRFRASRIARMVKRDTSIDLSAFGLVDQLPPNVVRIAESGVNITNVGAVAATNKFHAALVGTGLLQCNHPQGVLDNLNQFAQAVRSASLNSGQSGSLGHVAIGESGFDQRKAKRRGSEHHRQPAA